MDLAEVLQILKDLADNLTEVDGWDDNEEKVKFEEMLENFNPSHREFVLQLRDDCLDASQMQWALLLSHVAHVMTEPGLWEGKEVQLSWN